MNWYKKSQAMFETFDLEDKLIQSFNNHFQRLIRKYGIESAQESLNKNHSIYLGSSNISNAMLPIIKKYGNPKTDIPKQIHFAFLSNKHPEAKGEDASAIFGITTDGQFMISKVLDNLRDFYKNENFKYSIAHEIQHFLKILYEGKPIESSYYKANINSAKPYYENPKEIQSYSAEIAKRSFNTLKEIIETRIKNTSAQESQRILSKINEKRNSFISNFLQKDIQKFINNIEIDENVKRQYYEATIRNFNRLFDKFVEEKNVPVL